MKPLAPCLDPVHRVCPRGRCLLLPLQDSTEAILPQRAHLEVTSAFIKTFSMDGGILKISILKPHSLGGA